MGMIDLKPLINKASGDSSVVAIILFGSYARQEARPDSDVDICLVLNPDVDAKQAFDMRLGYMADFDVDVHVYAQVPLYIRQRILKEGKVLYCANEELLYSIACQTITEFADYEHIYRDYLEEIKRG